MSDEGAIEFVIRLKGGSEAADQAKKVGAAVEGVGGKMRTVSRESTSAGKAVSGFGGGLKRLAIGLGAVGAGYAAWNAAKGAITYTTELAKNTNTLSKATHMSVGQTSSLIAVSGALGVESSKLAMLFTKLGKATEKQAESNGKSKTAFDKLGISQSEARAHLNDTAGMLDIVTRKLAEGHIPAAEKAAVMTELFGRSWLSLGPLLLEGETNLGKLTSMAKEFGLELGGKGVDSLKKFHDEQVESKLAMEGLQVSFTKLVAGPLGGVLSGFAKLTVYARKGEWGKFNAQVGQMAKSFENLAEKVMPRVAESFAHVAPAVLKAFWNGFKNAPLGSQALLAGILFTKMGLTGGIIKGIGAGVGKKLVGGILGEQVAMAGSGTLLGAAFGTAFQAAAAIGIAAVVAYAAYELGMALRGAQTQDYNSRGEALSKSQTQSFERDQGAKLHHVLQHTSPAIAKRTREHDRYMRGLGPKPKAADGASVIGAGMVEVGERGPELLHLPAGAQVEPLKPGSMRPIIENVIKLDSRVLARSNREQTLQSQAAGA